MNDPTVYYTHIKSPHGEMLIAGTEKGLTHINFQAGAKPVLIEEDWVEDDALLKEACDQLHRYFYGELTEFNLALNPQGTEFQRSVWDVLMTIPCGETVSYVDIAKQMGQATATRAVATANGQNPIAVVIPCHRVIGSDGKLRGYAGGLDIKALLLDLERSKAGAPGGQLYLG